MSETETGSRSPNSYFFTVWGSHPEGKEEILMRLEELRRWLKTALGEDEFRLADQEMRRLRRYICGEIKGGKG